VLPILPPTADFSLRFLNQSKTKSFTSNRTSWENISSRTITEMSKAKTTHSQILQEFISMNPVTLSFSSERMEAEYQSTLSSDGCFEVMMVYSILFLIAQYTIIPPLFAGHIGDVGVGEVFREISSVFCLLGFVSHVDSMVSDKAADNHWIVLKVLSSLHDKILLLFCRSENLLWVFIVISILLTQNSSISEAAGVTRYDLVWFYTIMLLVILATRMSFPFAVLLQIIAHVGLLVNQDSISWMDAICVMVSSLLFTVIVRRIEVNNRHNFRLISRLAAENIEVRMEISTQHWFRKGRRRGTSAASAGISSRQVHIEESHEETDSFAILSSELVFESTIGSGSTGEVLVAKWQGTTVAVKKIHGPPLKEEIINFGQEASILSSIRHPNIVLFLGLSMTPIMIVMEYLPNGSLFNIVHVNERTIDLTLKLRVLLDTAKGMNYLHYRGIHHNDLKSLNLLLDADWRCKVCDFGFSQVRSFVKQPFGEESSASTLGWASPEALSNEPLDGKNDVYSFGVVVFELLYEAVPFKEVGRNTIPMQVLHGRRPEDFVKPIHFENLNTKSAAAVSSLQTLMRSCWDQNQDLRPAFETIIPLLESIGDEFFESSAWEINFPDSKPTTPFTAAVSINPEELILGPQIGKGSFGAVFEARYHDTTVAVKSFYNSGISADVLEEFKQECELMIGLRHPNVVLFMGMWAQSPQLLIVTELMSRGSVYSYYKNNKKPLPKHHVKLLIRIAEGMCKGLSYLHNHKPAVIHRDVKSPNVLLDEHFNAKIADFGLSRIREEGKTMTCVGSPLWAAPEVLRGEEFGLPSDIYSLGVVCWEILEWQEPYPGLSSNELMVKVAKGLLKPEIRSYCVPELKTIIEQCLDNKPDNRPTFSEILAL